MAAARKSAVSKLNTPGKIAVGGFMLVLPAIGYYIVFHSEIQSEIHAEENSHLRLRSELEDAQRAERVYQKDLEELGERERNKRELMKILPATTEYPAFLSSIQNVANLVGVDLRAWTPLEEVPEEFYSRVPMQLELEGRFHQLAKFFYNVGQLERIINMENISLTDPKEKDGEVRLKASVLATAFHAAQDKQDESGPASRKRRDRTP